MADPLIQIAAFVIFIYSVVLHELAHGLAARSMGDHTAEHLGRLTLNPLKHLDMVGSFLLPLVLYLANSPFLFGYAKPVPYNPRNLNDRHWGPAKVAIAGPATNVLLAILASVVFRVLGMEPFTAAGFLVGSIVWINVALALFNLLPVPPLDGHWLLGALFPGAMRSLYSMQWLLLIVVIFIIFPALTPVIGWIFHLLTGAPSF